MSRPKIQLYVIGDEEDAAILRCVIYHCGWAEPSGKVQECRAAFVITGTLRMPLAEAQDALRRARSIPRGEQGNLPVIVLARASQMVALQTASCGPVNVQLRGRTMFVEWDKDWAGILERARVITRRHRGPRKGSQREPVLTESASNGDAPQSKRKGEHVLNAGAGRETGLGLPRRTA